ncbi:S1 RNA-binding domain-containing protein 1 [Anoplolepis gracilipes]|uniref:S1 RNA-binding domain-containing protein 1 n=1 Tax=Anoplolepis gracilipes TaxID=354296 RepID=UPI003B9EB1A6
MKRILRSKCNQPIIEISDSDDEDHKTNYQLLTISESEDEDYTIEESKAKKKLIKNKKQSTKEIKNNKKNNKQNKVKSEKRKSQEENLEIFNNKKPKLEESPFDNYENNSDVEVVQQNQKNLMKTDIKQDIKIKEKLNSSFLQCTEWTPIDYISEINKVDKNIVKNVVILLQMENTIPFIARYRKQQTGSMEPDQLRALKESFEEANIIKNRAATILKTIDKLGKWSPEIHSTITSAKSLADLEDIYALYKLSSKRILAERARELGLENISNAVLHGRKITPLVSLINEQKEGLRNEQQVKNGIVHIIADVIAKDKKVFNAVTSFRKISVFYIQTSQCKVTKDLNENEQKYKDYFNFRSREDVIKPHHILAINRAESQKIISVKIIVPDTFECAFKEFCLSQYTRQQNMGDITNLHQDLLNDSIDHAYKKLIKPQVIRRIRSQMKERAEKASIQVFATNVKHLLLTPPVRGKIILGIDPGYYHGCKLAVISEHGNVLETTVIHPHKNKVSISIAADSLAKLVNKYKCTVLALGNATACRKTELFLTEMIQSKMFGSLDVTYTIVDESGASIYSCSSEAKSEFSDLDPNLVSAISIARRLQDPLAELVKIEPKHLGVGMYQHDLPEKQLMNTLDEVVTEAVSFVGVDVNTASQCLLRRVAGLTNSRAANIIEWRIKHGAFRNREQLLDVKGIGKKTFEQCAGFIRIRPETAMISETITKGKKSKNDLNILDQTWIHPESYVIANKFLKHCQCKLDDLGTSAFIERINSHAKAGCAKLAAQFDTDETTMEIIIKALTMKKDEDIRLKSNYPLFRAAVQSINDLRIDTILTGIVRNVTHFGAFVDVGVEKDGLIHISRMKNHTLHVGQHVEVNVINIEVAYNRIGLELIRIL